MQGRHAGQGSPDGGGSKHRGEEAYGQEPVQESCSMCRMSYMSEIER